jgi:AcrR family transcriptional regulator
VQSVGIERVIETAGVAKATLYNTFGSKEALVRAYLEEQHADTVGRLTAAIAAAASSEAPRGGLVERAADEYRAAIRVMFRDLADEAGPADPDMLAAQLQVIHDGAGLGARMDRRP